MNNITEALSSINNNGLSCFGGCGSGLGFFVIVLIVAIFALILGFIVELVNYLNKKGGLKNE